MNPRPPYTARPTQPPATRCLWIAILLSLLGIAGPGGPAMIEGQLISPGKLTNAHVDLEGFRNCTQCHRQREKGISEDLCVACHTPLGERIEGRSGLHPEFVDEDCGSCHKEHIGRDADIVRFSTDDFEHERAGFELVEAHGSLTCAECHNRTLVRDPAVRRFKAAGGALDDTFLGLGTTCVACHVSDDPHDSQFQDDSCSDCHTQAEWEGADRYDHERSRYQLTGLHTQLECTSCHGLEAGVEGKPMLRFKPLSFGSCTSCHVDNHEGSMGADCTECHSTSGWNSIPRSAFEEGFDHGRTSFGLVGAHVELTCASCHQPSEESADRIQIQFVARSRAPSYPSPVVNHECLSCHVDRHEGVFEDPSDYSECMTCHSEHAWTPSTFDLFRHDSTAFPLSGAHLAVQCASCHGGVRELEPWNFVLGTPTCAQCHETDDPHAGQFEGRACTECHSDDSFRIEEFDHSRTAYELDGAHADLSCVNCHVTETENGRLTLVRYLPLPTDCNGCHLDRESVSWEGRRE